jgi:hypothetical protein
MAKFVRERKYGNPLHLLGMPKAIREQIGKSPGDAFVVDGNLRNRHLRQKE